MAVQTPQMAAISQFVQSLNASAKGTLLIRERIRAVARMMKANVPTPYRIYLTVLFVCFSFLLFILLNLPDDYVRDLRTAQYGAPYASRFSGCGRSWDLRRLSFPAAA